MPVDDDASTEPAAAPGEVAPPPAAPAGWAIRVVPVGIAGPEREYAVTARQLAWMRAGAFVAAILAIGLFAAVLTAVPRARAYSAVVDENLELKARLAAIDRKMTEVDRVLLRLRLYDAQLKGITTPTGDHGPVDPSAFEGGHPLGAYADDGEFAFEDEGVAADELRRAAVWADGIEARVTTFLKLFERAEPDLAAFMEDVEEIRALESALPTQMPARGVLSSDFGWRRSPMGGRRWKFHSGLDIAGRYGSTIVAAADGVVVKSEYDSGYGRHVEIDHGFGIHTVYAHCSRVHVKVGQRVARGERIARMGSTGYSTGTHLHFEVRLDGHAVDPMSYLRR